MMVDSFKNYHPLVNFIYLSFILIFNMFILNPVLQIISLLVGLAYKYILAEGNVNKRFILYFLFILLFSPVFNSLFNHKGGTILFYLKNGNPITKESIIYGLSSGLMFINMLIWFSCYNEIMTSDKFMHIFGNIIPALSLIITMILRFVPRYVDRIKIIYNSQKAIGEEISEDGIVNKARGGMKILSIMTTWALENSIDTSDSMKARGYGMGKRTSFSNFTMTRRDKGLLITIIVLILIVSSGVFRGDLEMVFFPNIIMKTIDSSNIYLYISFLLLLMTPIILNAVEEIRWHYLKSKI